MPAKPVMVKAAFEAAEEPAAEPVEEPAEEPAEESEDETAEEAAEEPEEEPVEETAEEPAEEPAEESEAEPAEDSEEEPAEESEDEPAEASEEEDEEGSVEELEDEETEEEEPDGASVILTQPANQAANNGDMVSFTVSAVSGAVIKWQVDRGDGNSFVNLSDNSAWSGTNTDTLTFKAIPAREPFKFRAAVTSNGTTVNSKAVTFDLIPVILIQPVSQNVQLNETVQFIAQAQYAESYRWQVDRQDGKGFVNLSDNTAWSGTTTETLSFTAIPARAPFKFRVLAKNGIASKESDAVEFIITPVIDPQPADQFVALNEMVSFHTGVQNAESIRWQIDRQDGAGFVDLKENSAWSGTATDTLTFKAITARLSFMFRIVASSGSLEILSDPVRFYFKPVFDQHPTNQLAALNTTVTFTAHATDADAYQWQVDRGDGNGFVNLTENSAWSGTKTESLSFKAIAARKPFTFRVVASNNGGLCTAESDEVTWDIPVNPPVILTQPANQEAEENANVVFTVEAENADTYQWQVDRKDGLGFVNLKENSVWVGTKTNTLTFTAIPAREAYAFRVKVSNSAAEVSSAPCDFTIVPGIDPPQITSEPADQLAHLNDTVSLTAGVLNADSLRWQVDRQDGKGFVNLTENSVWHGTGTETLSFKAIEARRNFSFRLKAVNGGGETVSGVVMFDLLQNPTVTVTADQTAVANGQPVHLTASVENTQGAVAYLWQQKWTDQSVWETAFENTGEAVLMPQGSCFISQLEYRCAVTDDNGTWYSDPVSIGYIPPELSITADREIVTIGTTVTLTVTAINFSSGATYQWQRCATDSTNVDDWQNVSTAHPSYSFLVLSSASLGYYRCIVTDINCSWYSNTVRIRKVAAPVFTLQPVSQQAMVNQPVVFTAQAEDATAYQWEVKRGSSTGFANLADDDDWSGTKTDTLTFPAKEEWTNYQFRLKASSPAGSKYSDTVTYSLITTPTVTVTTDIDYLPSLGQTVHLTASVYNTQGIVSYEWQQKRWVDEGTEWETDWETAFNNTGTACMDFVASLMMYEYKFRCVITDSSGTWYSEAFEWDYFTPCSDDIIASTTSARAGTTVILTLNPDYITDDVVGFQWMHCETYSENEDDWVDVGCSDDTYTFTLSPSTVGFYRCVLTFSNQRNCWLCAKQILIGAEKYRALLIGNNSYSDSDCTDNGQIVEVNIGGGNMATCWFNTLPSCVNDMDAMQIMLGTAYDYIDITKVPNASAATILNSISTAFSGATNSDVSLFYYSGHGFGLDEADLARNPDLEPLQGGLVGVDAEIVTLSELVAALNQVPGTVIVILDCCYSGAAIWTRGASAGGTMDLDAISRRVLSAFSGYTVSTDGIDAKSGELRTSKYKVLASSSYLETSSSGYPLSLFTEHLVMGAGCNTIGYQGSMPADTDGNLQLTLYEAYLYTKNHVLAEDSTQTVQRYGGDDFILLYRQY